MTKAPTGLRGVQVCVGILFIVIAVLTLGPFQGAESQFGLSDKEAHLLAFFCLTLLLQAALPSSRRILIIVSLLGFGALIEVVQFFTGRSANVFDFTADAVGVAMASVAALFEKLRMHFKALISATSDTPDI
ncbi:VanZ family protein [Asticcacaulis sp. W401b]|uniref:VanZ family protein n=1 Tax=Asticcacaulis sp. W401b TaxID=3388666 RepID=UPI003970F9A5